MNNSKYKRKSTIVNKFKLIYMPLFIGLFAILTISTISYCTSKSSLLAQMKQNGVNLAKQTDLQVEGNAVSLEVVNRMIEDKIRTVGKAVMIDQNNLSNDLLKKIGNDLGVDEINWYSSEGEIIYSNIDAYLGWKPAKDHPVENFRLSGKNELMEEIRKDTESVNYKKYGYLRNANGTFIQIGIKANEVESLTKKFNYQTLIEKLAQEENIAHVLFVDKNLKAIADSNIKDVGIIYDKNKQQEMQDALKGKISTKEWYYKEIDAKALTIYVPVAQNGEISNVLVISLSTEKVYASIYMLAIRSSFIAIIMLCMLFWVQNKNVIKPVNQLDQYINEIDVEKNINYRLSLAASDTFFGLAFSINNILDKTFNYFYQIKEHQEELQASNEEVLATYEQLAASEEELRAQYDEIQCYTEKIENLKQKYEIAIEGTNSAVWEFNIEDETIYFSEGVKNIVGISIMEKENINKVLSKLLTVEDKEKLIKKFIEYKSTEKEEIYEQVKIKDNDGSSKWILIRGKGIFHNNKNIKLINGILLDITQIKEQEEYIEHIAYHDSLTNLPNRRKFIKTLEEEISENKFGAVILLDLDNFKGINDTLGHTYGDKVLKKVAEKLEDIVDEKLFVSRFGGDEFFILIQGEKDIAKIENYAKQITNVFRKKLIIESEEIYLSCSMGLTLYPFDSNEVSQLIMNADMAMYKVKNAGKNNYMFFNEEMTEKLQEQIKVERVLREAIKKDELKLVYQPQVCTFEGKIVGFEALLRLKNHYISPAQFIPVAEETGMIIEIGRWVTKEAIKQIVIWRNMGLDIKPIAINFSAKQLNDLNYVEFLENALKEMNVEAKYIDIEITESIFLEKKEETIEFLKQLKTLGVKIALDDFGTGYSSLSYLTFLPVDKIKLDKSLNDKFLELENIKVMESLISLAHSLNLEVVAEGIEDVAQYKRLKVAGCNYIQGYLFSKPLDAKDAEKIYNDNFLDKIL
jgi:diguanylate cyclase (GGDEF)-like protein/PAS domain S-box-containing protein